MKPIKKVAALMVAACLVAFAAGCGNSGSSGNGAAENASGGGNAAGGDKQKKIAVIVKSTDAPYWQTVKKGAEEEAKKNGVDMYFTGAAGSKTDINGQVNLVETAINQKVDGIVLAPSDSDALVPAVDKASKAGIPVVIIDSGINTENYLSYATTNNEDAAYQVGKKLAEMVGGKGTVAILGFQPGAGSNTARENGFKKAIAEHPDMKIVTTQYSQSDKTKALSVTQDILTAHPDLTALFAANEPSVVGAGRAFKEKNVTGTILVGFDSSDDVIPLLKDGIIKAVAVQMPYTMGVEGIKQLVNSFSGAEVTKSIDTGTTLVATDNMEDPASQAALYPLK